MTPSRTEVSHNILFVKDSHKYITQNSLEQIQNELGKCVAGSLSSGRRPMPAADLVRLSACSPFPVPSAILAGIGAGMANISCQFIFISQRLVAASKNTPTTLFDSSKDRKWRVPALSLSPFQGHKWTWKPSRRSLLTGCHREKHSAHGRAQSALSLRVTSEAKEYN